jgi:hypothetical protein
MEFLKLTFKVLMLMICAAFALGFGVCGTWGVVTGLTGRHDIVGQGILIYFLIGLGLMMFVFARQTWLLLKGLFSQQTPSDSSEDDA